MEISLEIAAIVALIITNIAAIFFIKSRYSSIIVISLSVFFLIGLNSLIYTDNTLFLKISFVLIVFLTVANYLFSLESRAEDHVQKSKQGKGLKTFLSLAFLLLFFSIIYLGSPVVKIDSTDVVLSKQRGDSLQDASNLWSLRSIKVKKIRVLTKDNVIMNNLTLMVLLSAFLPLILLVIEKTKPKNI